MLVAKADLSFHRILAYLHGRKNRPFPVLFDASMGNRYLSRPARIYGRISNDEYVM